MQFTGVLFCASNSVSFGLTYYLLIITLSVPAGFLWPASITVIILQSPNSLEIQFLVNSLLTSNSTDFDHTLHRNVPLLLMVWDRAVRRGTLAGSLHTGCAPVVLQPKTTPSPSHNLHKAKAQAKSSPWMQVNLHWQFKSGLLSISMVLRDCQHAFRELWSLNNDYGSRCNLRYIHRKQASQ